MAPDLTAQPSPTFGSLGLEIRSLRVQFGGLVALESVDVSVEPGEVVGIIGPNGAGKTTVFNVVCGFVRPASGDIRWRGEPLTPRPHELARSGIARTLQGIGLCPDLTVLENVQLGADPAGRRGFWSAALGLPRSARSEAVLRDKAFAALELTGTDHLAHRLPGALPYPEQKQVALAKSIVSSPDLLLLDEPAGGLGAGDIDRLGTFVKDFAADGKRSVLLVEHHMDLVMRVCDRICVLDFGRVVAAGTPAEISSSAAVAEAYLGVAPGETSTVASGSSS